MRVLVLGVGNVFMGDDGCGVAVAQSLEGQVEGGDVRDLGTGGLPAVDFMSNYDLVVIVDAAEVDDVKVIEVGDKAGEDEIAETVLSMAVGGSHGLGVMDLINLVRVGGDVPKIVIVGCRPERLEVGIGLSREMVGRCVKAIEVISELLSKYNVRVNVDGAKSRLLHNELARTHDVNERSGTR